MQSQTSAKINNKGKQQKTPGPLPKPLIKPQPPPTPGKLKRLSPPPPPDEAPVPFIYDAIPVAHNVATPVLKSDGYEPQSASRNLTVVSESSASSNRGVKVVPQQSSAVNGKMNSHMKAAPISAAPLSLAGSKRKSLTEMLAKPSTHVRFSGDADEEDHDYDNMDYGQEIQSEASSVSLSSFYCFLPSLKTGGWRIHLLM